jgi:hypothetical protein
MEMSLTFHILTESVEVVGNGTSRCVQLYQSTIFNDTLIRSVPSPKIKEIILVECFEKCQIRFFLMIQLRDLPATQLHPVAFSTLRPRLSQLTPVYKELKQLLSD